MDRVPQADTVVTDGGRDSAYRDCERAVLDHLGREFFFSKYDRHRPTKTPKWPQPDDWHF